jgi:hypothetical protein
MIYTGWSRDGDFSSVAYSLILKKEKTGIPTEMFFFTL